MSLQNSLRHLCTPAVFRRGQLMAATDEKVHRRKCRYEGGETILDARVDSSSSWDGPHRPQVIVDEQKGEVTYFECDCDASRGTGKPCKHAVALVLDFIARPELYDGYDAMGHLATSRVLERLIRQASSSDVAVVGALSERHPGTVSFDVTLAYEAGFNARFRLRGQNGGYVLKSISDFVGAVEAAEYVAYGKKLSFVHAPEAFTSQGRRVADFLVRAVRNRRAYAFDRAVGTGPLGTNGAPQREIHLSSVELWDLLQIMMGGRVFFEDRVVAHSDDVAVRELQVREGDPELGFSLQPLQGGSYELVRSSAAHVVFAGGRAVAWDADVLYCCTDSFSRSVQPIMSILGVGAQRLTLAEHDVSSFASAVLPLLEQAADVTVPKALEDKRPLPCELQFYLDRDKAGILCRGFAVYGDQRFGLMDRAIDPKAEEAGRPIVRDAKREAAGRSVLKRYFVGDDAGTLRVPAEDEQAMAAFVFEGTEELQGVGTVFATDAFDRLKSRARPHAKVDVSVRSNLLDVRVGAEGLDARELSELLESYRLRKRYHLLRDGSFLDIAKASLSDAAALIDELGISKRDLARGEVQIPAYRAFLLDDDVRRACSSASLERYLEGILAIDTRTYAPPEELVGVLRTYQREGFGWMSSLVERGLAGILADEMGLGKSLQLITLLLARKDEAQACGPSLIVCPASLVYNWAQECEKFAPALRVSVVTGAAHERSIARNNPCDVLITSYDALRRDIDEYAMMRLWLVALDEAQYIKNPATLASRAVRSLDCRHRLALTGTPVENRLSELWSIFDFLLPGLLGTYDRFRERFERPALEEPKSKIVERLGKALGPFILRRTKREVLQDLPEKLEQVVYARMGAEQRALYDAQVFELRSTLADEGADSSGKGRMQVLAALTRLRQTCCDPRLVFEDYDDASCKVDTILTLVRRVVDADEKVLLFSQFASFLDILADRLGQQSIPYFMLKGSTPKRRRMELVNTFNSDDTPVFLISLKAGGTGLNLTGASVVIHADPWWNSAAQDQATDRAHRIGQTRDVVVYKVICANTLEERILELQRQKTMLATHVVGAAASRGLSSLSVDELAELLW